MELSSISIAITSLVGALFSPGAIFTTGVNGAWYDPSDFSTMFQDAAGTTPVTAVGQPVGLILDKSGRGNHAFNPSGNSANFPVLSARYNLLTKSEQFDDVAWTKGATTVTANATTAPDGTSTADKLVEDATTNWHLTRQAAVTLTNGISYVFSVYAKAAEETSIALTDVTGAIGATFNLSLGTAAITGTDAGLALSSPMITSVGNGWYKCSVTMLASSGSRNPTIYLRQFATSFAGTAGNGLYIWGADLRVTNDALNQPSYQRVNTATDYDTVGFKPYLSFNGVNQWLQTNSIDFTYGDKMLVSAGVRKLSDGNYKALVELSTSPGSAGTFWMAAPGGLPPSTGYSFETSGTAASGAFANSGYPQPITNVISGIGNISAPSATLRVNGTQAAQSSASQGTGNYGNHPLYIGARAGSSLWFNGRLYGLVVAGKAASASEIASTEVWLNQKTGAY